MKHKKIEFFRHNLTSIEKKAALSVLDSLFLTTGSVVKEFEEKFAKYLQVKYVAGVTSCTDALFLSLKGLGIQLNDEVITTPLSFISTANVIEHCGATPVFVDVEETTGNINADLIEKAITKKTKAIIVVHLYGHMADMKKIKKIADKYKLKIIEDSAHCIEGIRDGFRPGQLGDAACFSFYAIKTITSGEGGAIATNNKRLYEWLLKARLHGMSKGAVDRYHKNYEHYDMEFLGYKANMTNIQASLLLNQLTHVEKLWEKREKIAKQYNNGFNGLKEIGMPAILEGTKPALYVYTIWVNPKKRDQVLQELQDKGIGVAVNFRPIHLMKYYKLKYNYKRGDFPIAERIGGSTITLPLYPKLQQQEVRYIIQTVKEVVKAVSGSTK